MAKRRKHHGPRRAGRPVQVEGRREIAVQLTDEQIQWLDRKARAEHSNRSAILRSMVARAMRKAGAS